MQRKFVYDGREFPDPDPKLSVEDVRRQLSEFFPELTNADTREEKRGDDEVLYTFSKRIGTKGAPPPGRRRADRGGTPSLPRAVDAGETTRIVQILQGVSEKRLAVFELAAELIGPDGEVGVEAAADRQPEVNLAIAEAQGYAQATDRAVEALRRLSPR